MSEAVGRRLLPAPVLLARRPDERQHWLDRVEHVATALPARASIALTKRRLQATRDRVMALEPEFTALSEAELAQATWRIRDRLRREPLGGSGTVHGFALVREISARWIGLRHYPCQVLGGLSLVDGRMIEMDTGEGKTLTATLAAGVAALSGVPTHVVTVNDYLARRDAETMMPLYEALGLRVGVIDGNSFPQQRKDAYACDITYCSSSELTFDYLRDRLALGQRSGNLGMKVKRLTDCDGHPADIVMRGLHYAIVDEADSVLIDQARTPLIIATETSAADERTWAETAFDLADGLENGTDYTLYTDRRTVELTRDGKRRLQEAAERVGGIWRSRVRREESVRQALSARHLFHPGEHYIVRDGKVQIVDEYSGRVMPDRSWNEGMHQLVEVKEGVEVTGRKVASSKTSYQRFFRRYRRLCGMTGTAREVKSELRAIYRLNTVRIEPHRPPQRRLLRPRIVASLTAKYDAIARCTTALTGEGRPVLIGTRTIRASQELSFVLVAAGIRHMVLNAEHEAEEAEIIAEAGQPSRVTIATNMAGRGVDILLGPGVAEAGGLHVILSELHDARRIDRQLYGRTGRQGTPGSAEAILSLEDPILTRRKEARGPRRLAGAAALRLMPLQVFRGAQIRAERLHFRIRKDLLKVDEKTRTLLAMAGDAESTGSF